MQRLAAAILLFLLCACASGPTRPVSPTVPLPPPPPTGEPADFIGISGSQLRASLGTPAFLRKESGSEMWRYDTPQCRVFFFLYPAGSAMSVRHVETVPRGKDAAADIGCLNVLRGKTPAS